MQTLRFAAPANGEGRFIRQAGPPGRYGHVVLVVEPTPGAAFSFSWDVPEAEVPRIYEGAVRRGVLGLFEHGAQLDGWSSSGINVRVVGGSCHATDSNEVSYTLAAAAAILEAISSAHATSAA